MLYGIVINGKLISFKVIWIKVKTSKNLNHGKLQDSK